MPFYELQPDEVDAFLNHPEISSGVQIGRMWQNPNDPEDEFEIVFVFGGRIAFEFTSSPERDLADYLESEWLKRRLEFDERLKKFEDWINVKAKRSGKMFAPFTQISRSLTPVPLPATMPAAPAVIYGHVPYLSKTQAADVFYHFEPFPSPSRRLHLDASGV